MENDVYAINRPAKIEDRFQKAINKNWSHNFEKEK